MSVHFEVTAASIVVAGGKSSIKEKLILGHEKPNLADKMLGGTKSANFTEMIVLCH